LRSNLRRTESRQCWSIGVVLTHRPPGDVLKHARADRMALQMMDELSQPNEPKFTRSPSVSADGGPHNRDTENRSTMDRTFLALCCLVLIPWTIGSGRDTSWDYCRKTGQAGRFRHHPARLPLDDAGHVEGNAKLQCSGDDHVSVASVRCMVDITHGSHRGADCEHCHRLFVTSHRRSPGIDLHPVARINMGVARHAEPTAMLQPLWRTLSWLQQLWYLRGVRGSVLGTSYSRNGTWVCHAVRKDLPHLKRTG